MRCINIISHTLLFFLLTAFGCNDEKITVKEPLPENCETVEIQEGCQFSLERKTVDVFTNVQGVIQKIKLTSEHTLYVVSPEIKSEHMFNEMLAPCNLPEELRKEGLGVVFSGNLKETFEHKDIIAIYIELTDICKIISDENYVEVTLEQQQCEFDPKRKTISFFEDISGIIRSQESAGNRYYFIEIQENKYNYDGDLFPCNLPEEAKEDGLQIKFNGSLKGLFDREDASGYPIELTRLAVKNRPE